MTRKPNGFYTDDGRVTALAVGIVAAISTLIYVAVKWALGVTH